MPDLAERPIFGTESSDRFPTVTMDLVQRVAQAFPDIIYVYDVREARNIYCNREIASVLGYSPEEARDFGPNFFPSLLHPADADAVTAGHANLRSALDGDMVSLTYRMRHRDGSWRWLQSRDRVFARDSDSRVTQIMGIAHDATQEHRAKQELTEAVERYRSLVSLLADWVWECGPDGAYTYVSPQAADLLGYSPEELLGRHPCQFMTAEEAARVRPALELAVAARKPFKGVGHSMIGKDKRTVHLEVSGMPVFDSATRAWRGYRGINRDVTARRCAEIEREAIHARALRRADLDSLTGLGNRFAFQRILERTIRSAAATMRKSAMDRPDKPPSAGGVRGVAIVLLDLDNLKFFNDVYGHGAGDKVLVLVAEALRSCCREGDALARLGGDEFAAMLPGLDRTSAERRLIAMKDAVRRIDYRPPTRAAESSEERAPALLSLSGGVGIMPLDGATAETVIAAADERLYRDKTSAHLRWSEEMRAQLSTNVVGFAAIDGLVTAVAAKDRYTLRHSEDVLVYAAMIGKQLGLSTAEIDPLKVAALLHDAGKIGVPERILRLPGALSPEEYEAVKLHAALGAALVESAAPELARRMPSVIPAIRHHHERWDGGAGGYPDRISGETIPLHARILAVADSFSAMTTDRPYRQGLSHAKAAERLCAGAGTQWDPRCVDAFLQARLRSNL